LADLGQRGDVQAVAPDRAGRAPAPQSLPLGLAEIGASGEVIGDLAGRFHPTAGTAVVAGAGRLGSRSATAVRIAPAGGAAARPGGGQSFGVSSFCRSHWNCPTMPSTFTRMVVVALMAAGL
jgi:hypothetical protein